MNEAKRLIDELQKVWVENHELRLELEKLKQHKAATLHEYLTKLEDYQMN